MEERTALEMSRFFSRFKISKFWRIKITRIWDGITVTDGTIIIFLYWNYTFLLITYSRLTLCAEMVPTSRRTQWSNAFPEGTRSSRSPLMSSLTLLRFEFLKRSGAWNPLSGWVGPSWSCTWSRFLRSVCGNGCGCALLANARCGGHRG